MGISQKSIFIAGTDTDIGKTYVTRIIAETLIKQKIKVVTQKWCNSGPIPTDIDKHGLNEIKSYARERLPYHFSLPASPHLAAKQAGSIIDNNYLKDCLNILERNFECVLIEGSGGPFVPLNHKTLYIDLIEALRLPVLLVAPERIGSINQTLVHLEAFKRRNIEVLGIVLNKSDQDPVDPCIIEDHKKQIEHFSQSKVIVQLNYLAKSDDFETLASLVVNHLKKNER